MRTPWSVEVQPPSDWCRLQRELYGKLFTVHLAVVGVYMQFQHLRTEVREIRSIAVIVLCIFVGAVLLIMPVLLLSIRLLLRGADLQLLKQSIEILTGRLSKDSKDNEMPFEFSVKLLRYTFVLIVLPVQCTRS